MFRPASQSLLRQSLPALRTLPSRRCLSTAPPAKKSRSWQSSAIRWGLAGAGVYYYNTSTVFAEEPTFNSLQPDPTEDTTSLPTLSSLSPSLRTKPSLYPSDIAPLPASPSPQTALDPTSSLSTSPDHQQSLEDTEEEASQQGAFNEETGEINWDCPCLGGMAHGSCGEEFRAAFSCFVYSKEEPKGMDCIERFKGMQDCFRKHPDEYGSELEDDEDGEMGDIERIGELGEGGDGQEEAVGMAREGMDKVSEGSSTVKERVREVAEIGVQKIGETTGSIKEGVKSLAEDVGLTEKSGQPATSTGQSAATTPAVKDLHQEGTLTQSKSRKAQAATKQVARDHKPQSESDELVPKAAHDATDAQVRKTEK